jgi:hypothetical protein
VRPETAANCSSLIHGGGSSSSPLSPSLRSPHHRGAQLLKGTACTQSHPILQLYKRTSIHPRQSCFLFPSLCDISPPPFSLFFALAPLPPPCLPSARPVPYGRSAHSLPPSLAPANYPPPWLPRSASPLLRPSLSTSIWPPRSKRHAASSLRLPGTVPKSLPFPSAGCPATLPGSGK